MTQKITFATAVELDIAKNVPAAILAYEKVIEQGNALLDAYINLAFIYWESSNPFESSLFDFRGGRELLEDLGQAWDLCEATLDKAEQIYGKETEIVFWKRYFNYITIGENFSLEERLELVKKPGSSNIPYFSIYILSEDTPEFRLFAQDLYTEAINQPTTKNRYIISMLESYFNDFIEYSSPIDISTITRKTGGCSEYTLHIVGKILSKFRVRFKD